MAACGVTAHGELTQAQCSNGATDAKGFRTGDDDGDGLFDCEDPDCWVYASCLGAREAAAGSGDAATGGELDAGGASDATVDGSPAMDRDAGPTTPTDDAMTVDPCASVTCPTMSICNASGMCVVPDFPIDLDIQMASAAVSIANAASTCWDFTCKTGISIPNFVCSCAPDTRVTVLVNDVVAGESSVVEDKLDPVWPTTEPQIRTRLTSAQDVITFLVADYDSETMSDEIFTCTPDLSKLDTATKLECTKVFIGVQGVPPPKDGLFRVTANLKRVLAQ